MTCICYFHFSQLHYFSIHPFCHLFHSLLTSLCCIWPLIILPTFLTPTHPWLRFFRSHCVSVTPHLPHHHFDLQYDPVALLESSIHHTQAYCIFSKDASHFCGLIAKVVDLNKPELRSSWWNAECKQGHYSRFKQPPVQLDRRTYQLWLRVTR